MIECLIHSSSAPSVVSPPHKWKIGVLVFPAATATAPSLLAFTIPNTSSDYGILEGDVVTLSLTSTDALVTTFDIGK